MVHMLHVRLQQQVAVAHLISVMSKYVKSQRATAKGSRSRSSPP